jgi:fatty acid-binding protein DegV
VKHLVRRIHDHGLAPARQWALGHADAGDAGSVTDLLTEAFGQRPAFVVPVDITVGVHLGPDSLVVGILR